MSLWLNTTREEPGNRAASSSGPTDTMLRLNIRCLNNQARFDPAKEKERGTEEEDERSRLWRTGRRRKRRRFRFRPSGNGTRSSPFLVFDLRQILPPAPPFLPSSLRLCLTLRRLFSSSSSSSSSFSSSSSAAAAVASFLLSLPPSSPPTFFRILPRHPYRKCIYVLCKAGNRRWPREPDARRVINTDALVLSLSSTLPPSLFLSLCSTLFHTTFPPPSFAPSLFVSR